jgi:hypothetical protein
LGGVASALLSTRYGVSSSKVIQKHGTDEGKGPLFEQACMSDPGAVEVGRADMVNARSHSSEAVQECALRADRGNLVIRRSKGEQRAVEACEDPASEGHFRKTPLRTAPPLSPLTCDPCGKGFSNPKPSGRLLHERGEDGQGEVPGSPGERLHFSFEVAWLSKASANRCRSSNVPEIIIQSENLAPKAMCQN